jgi:hypothetical protein
MCGSANAPEDFVARKLEGSFGEIDLKVSAFNMQRLGEYYGRKMPRVVALSC